jgi:hypothetical protein
VARLNERTEQPHATSATTNANLAMFTA